MTKYSLKKENDKFYVYEGKTEIYFGPYPTKNDARKHMKHMNMGGAFDGFTPSFMLIETTR